jgi:hypothetical protein
MKRLLILALLALGLTVALAPAASPAGDAQGPPCSNITDRDIFYGLDGVIDFTLYLQAPACSFVNYSTFVTDTDGNPVPVTPTQDASCTPATPDGGCLHFVYDLGANGPATVCYSAETDIKGQHVADLAPDAADPTCQGPVPSFSLGKGGSGASGGFG